MKYQHTYIVSLIFTLFLFSCQSPKNLDEFEFLIGKWEGKQNDMTFHELWENEGGVTLAGQGVIFSGTDTLFHEKIKIEVRKDEIFYVATVPGNETPVSFKLVSSGKNHWSFENKTHDFPQEITYRLVEPDSLHATIQGNDNGKPSKEQFHFKKIN